MDMRKISQSRGFLIAVSILTALILWLYVDNAQERQVTSNTITVPVEFLGEEDILARRGLMVTDGEDVQVRFRLSGLREAIGDINTKTDQFRVQVNLTGITAIGTHSLDYDIIFPDSVSESDYTVDYASPHKITVTVAEMYQKEVVIRCEVTGEVPEGYMADEPQLYPGTLAISGLQENVSQVDHAVVEVDMTGATSDVVKALDFVLVDRDGNELDRSLFRTDMDNIQVTVPVLTIKEIPLAIDLVESPGSSSKDVVIDITPKSVTVAGDSQSLSNLERLVLTTIDLSELTGDTTREIRIPLPANSRLLDGEESAQVTISFVGVETRTYTTTAISYIHAPEGREVSIVTQEVDVTLRGPAEELDALSEVNIRVVGDLTDVSSANGNYAVPATVYVDGAENTGAVGTYQITIQISS